MTSETGLCPICGKEFNKKGRRLTCSRQCGKAWKSRYIHAYYLQKIKGTEKKPRKLRVCAFCGKEFYGQYSRSKCCSPECTAKRLEAYYKAYNERRRMKRGNDEARNETS